MAFMVLFATMSFSMDMHFCGKTLVDLKFYNRAETCGMEMQGMDTGIKDKESHCCSDVSIVVPGQDDLQNTLVTLTFEQQTFLVAFAHSHLLVLTESPEKQDPFEDYIPPPLIRDVQILNQTFLI